MTAGELMVSITRWLHENVEEDLLLEAIRDSVTSLWETLVLINLSEALGGPAQATFAPASDHADIVSVADPTVAPVVNQIVQGALAQHNVNVTYTLVTDSGGETLPSPATALLVLINNISFVTSPNHVQNAVGWNVYYAGIKQNTVPIPFGTDWYEAETGPVTDGALAPTENTTGDDIWYIKTLTVQTETGEKFWEETQVGSQVWKNYSNAIPSNSPYQPYVFDWDGSKIMIRPLAGSSLTADYVYVRRPRVTQKSSTIPFKHPGAESFIRYYSQSLIHLSNHEYTAAAAWEKKAEGQRLQIAQSANKKNYQKNTRVKPIFM